MSLPDFDTQAAIALAGSELIDLLDELFPEQSPDPRDTERDLWMKAGKRDLVRHLIHLRASGRVRRV